MNSQGRINLQDIGFIVKTHGFSGELVLALNNPQDFQNLKLTNGFLFVILEGLPVPFHIENVREKSGNIIVHLDTLTSEEAAKKLAGKKVMMEKSDALHADLDSDELSWDDLLGYTVIDRKYGNLGPLLEIQEYPMQYLGLCKHKDREILFPLHEDVIVEIDEAAKSISIEIPEGLIDLYMEDPNSG